MAGEPVRANARDVLYTLPLVASTRMRTETQPTTMPGRGRSPQQEKA